MKVLPLAMVMAFFAAPSFAQDAPAGASATGCDASSFTAVRSDRTGEILYWNNSTCSAPRSGPQMMMGDMGSDQMMDGGMMDGGMMGDSMSDGGMSDGGMMN